MGDQSGPNALVCPSKRSNNGRGGKDNDPRGKKKGEAKKPKKPLTKAQQKKLDKIKVNLLPPPIVVFV